MKETKSLRRSLLLSVLSLLICASMFVGTTFAWFTDSVASANNLIVSGNLDVELEYLNADGEWKPVTATTNVFKENTYWEPGHTEVVYLRISNVGSLALNYKLGVNIVEETKSVNVFDEELKLSEYIMMGAVKDVTAAYAERKDALAALDEDAVEAIAKGYAQDGVLYAKNNMPTDVAGATDVDYVALVVYMPESTGNGANHKKDAAIPTITLGINLLATQKTYEEDSFNDQYDADANVSAPPVPVNKTVIDVVDVFDIVGAGMPQTTLTDVEVDIYDFIATDYADAYPVEEYKDWLCDFYVSTDSPIENGTILLGNYGTFGWLGFWAPASDEPYAPTGLLGAVTNGGVTNWTYQDIVEGVQIFRCGVLDHLGTNEGVQVTVELRMMNPTDGTVIIVRSITVTL